MDENTFCDILRQFMDNTIHIYYDQPSNMNMYEKIDKNGLKIIQQAFYHKDGNSSTLNLISLLEEYFTNDNITFTLTHNLPIPTNSFIFTIR